MCTHRALNSNYTQITRQAIRDYILKQIKAMHKNLAMDPEATTLKAQS